MKRISRISTGIFFVLFCSLCILHTNSEARYKEHDIKAMGLWYEGSIYKANKEYSKAKEAYNQSLALAQSPTLRREIEDALYYVNKHIDMLKEE